MTTDVVTADVVDALTKRVEQLEQQMSQVQRTANARYPRLDTMFADNEMLARAFSEILFAHKV